ncbi:Multiple C2 and transmembrane domain-containing protein 2 [Toxocara canis]|uniref:Multiple C2 and transmembrane domain-containing protein 2 n=1 Tax=Toxocara canis TaxID=6265 RepID=A0A0B2UVF3_TOXCA|nr:Multiple C2 and transmembrane domain-containing protein 2 [Toxocara canis]
MPQVRRSAFTMQNSSPPNSANTAANDKRLCTVCSNRFVYSPKTMADSKESSGKISVDEGVFGCASALPTVDSEYRLAEVPAEENIPAKPVKKQRLWRSIKFTTSAIRIGGKSEVTNESLSTSAPELGRTSKHSVKEDTHKQSSMDGNRVTKDDEYVTFLVKVRLKDGKNLAVRDASGSSDPYVKFKYKNRTYFKSNTVYKNLNPVWEEEFSQLIDDPTTPIAVDVFDYDRFAADDYMGGGLVDLSQLRLFQATELKVKLKEEGSTDDMGEVNLVVTVTPLTQTEKEQFMKKCVRGITSEQLKRPQKVTHAWLSVANIVLVEGHNLTSSVSSIALPDPFVKFKLGSEKYKSKPASRTRNPKWLEQFDLHLYDEPTHILEVMVNDKRNNGCMGTYSIDLDKLDKESANQLLCELENGSGSVLLLISISGTTSTDAVVDLCEFTGNDVRNAIVSKYNILRTFQCLRDVGYLTVKVFQARDLIAADMGGKSDPFAVVELVNARLQTHTEYKTLNPIWNKLFTFAVKDIHAVLEITVYDEDPNKKAEFLGKVAIPLLKINNCQKRWYALKDRKLNQPSKGQIQVELDVIWNPIRAAIRTFNPREGKYMQSEPKFKRQVFMHNYSRLKDSLLYAIEIRDYVQSCFNWDSPKRSLAAFMIYLLWVYFFELYHIPLCILALFLRAHMTQYCNANFTDMTQRESLHGESYEDDETAEQDGSKKLKRQPSSQSRGDGRTPKLKRQASVQQSKDGERSSATLKDRLSAIQETLAMVQNTMDFIASLLERVKNTFNFTQPYLSILAIVVLIIATILLYIIPLRWILIAWGINKFTKKLRNPNFIPNNELLDFLSRVPSDAEIRAYEELKIDERLTTQSSSENSTAQRSPR